MIEDKYIKSVSGMKSFKEILKEGKQGNRPSVETSVSTNVSRRKRAPKSTELTRQQMASIWQAGAGSEGNPSVMATSSKPESGTWFGSSKEVIQKGQEAESKLRQQVRDTLTKNQGGSAELQAAQSSGPKETMVGKGAKPGTGETYRANRPSDTQATGVVDTPKKPEAIDQAVVSKRAERFRQSFGTPTGADPFTGKPTYKPLEALTDLPKGKGGKTPSPEAYSKVKVGDLDAKRLIRTTGPQGVPTDKGVENFLLNRETKGALGGRNARRVSPEEGKAALERVKGFMADPEEVAKVKGQIKQEVGGRRAQLENPPSRPSRSTAAATGSTTARSSTSTSTSTSTATTVNPSKPVEISGSKPKTSTSTSTSTVTDTKVRQPLNLAIAQDQPKTTGTKEFKIPKPTKKPNVSPRKTYSDFAKELGTTSSRTGAWSYSPQRATTLDPKGVPDDVMKQFKEVGWDKPGSSSAAEKSRIDHRVRSVTKMKQTNPASYAREVQRRATNIGTIRATKSASGLGVLSAPLAGFDAYQQYQQARKSGQSKDYATKSAIATAGGGFVGAEAGAKLGAKLGSVLGIKGAIAGGLLGGALGYAGGSGLGKAALGASERDKEWMKWANRAKQAGTSATNVTFRSGNKAIVKDKSGKERVGYLAYKGGKEVFKTANDPKASRYASDNAAERIGRTVADAGIPWASDFLKKRYAASDEAKRIKDVAAVKAAASK